MKQTKVKKKHTKIPKFTLQIYAFAYDAMMDFPLRDFIFETVTTQNFFENVYRIRNVKVHIHHSHVTV